MTAKSLLRRDIKGDFYHALKQVEQAAWIDAISIKFNSNQASETYAWLDQSPIMREWIGGREAKGLSENGITIANKKFEATLEIPADWVKFDKTGQINVRINELATRAASHWAGLLSSLIINGESGVCYDGYAFFSTSHPINLNTSYFPGTQSNITSLVVSDPEKPTPGELQTALMNGIEKILDLVDEHSQPLNEDAKAFTVMAPVPFLKAAGIALGADVLSGTSNLVQVAGSLGGFNVNLAVNPRLSWATKLAVFRADGDVSPFIRQEEENITISSIAEGSELEFNNDLHHYGIKAMRNVGYGYWQKACLVTLS